MLTKEDFQHNLRIINVCCKLGIIPLDLDVENGRLQPLESLPRRVACNVYFALFVAHVAYIVLRFPYLLLKGAQLPLLTLLVHFTVGSGEVAVLFWQFTAFFRYPGVTATCFNMALESWGCTGPGGNGKGVLSRAKDWTLQELLAVACPYCLVATATFLLTMYCFQQDMTTLLYSSLPAEYKTPFWFTLCFIQEANQMFYSLISSSVILQLHLLLPGKLSRVLKALAESAERTCGSPKKVGKIMRQIRGVQLVVNLFNVGHRQITYCIKLICITLSTVNGYGTIAHGGEDMVFLLLAVSVTCNLAFFYIFVYEKAFAIPDGLERVKRAVKVEIRGCNAGLKKVVWKELDAVPLVGLKVGDFHMLERESTPIFLDYVLRNIVNLLVTL